MKHVKGQGKYHAFYITSSREDGVVCENNCLITASKVDGGIVLRAGGDLVKQLRKHPRMYLGKRQTTCALQAFDPDAIERPHVFASKRYKTLKSSTGTWVGKNYIHWTMGTIPGLPTGLLKNGNDRLLRFVSVAEPMGRSGNCTVGVDGRVCVEGNVKVGDELIVCERDELFQPKSRAHVPRLAFRARLIRPVESLYKLRQFRDSNEAPYVNPRDPVYGVCLYQDRLAHAVCRVILNFDFMSLEESRFGARIILTDELCYSKFVQRRSDARCFRRTRVDPFSILRKAFYQYLIHDGKRITDYVTPDHSYKPIAYVVNALARLMAPDKANRVVLVDTDGKLVATGRNIEKPLFILRRKGRFYPLRINLGAARYVHEDHVKSETTNPVYVQSNTRRVLTVCDAESNVIGSPFTIQISPRWQRCATL